MQRLGTWSDLVKQMDAPPKEHARLLGRRGLLGWRGPIVRHMSQRYRALEGPLESYHETLRKLDHPGEPRTISRDGRRRRFDADMLEGWLRTIINRTTEYVDAHHTDEDPSRRTVMIEWQEWARAELIAVLALRDRTPPRSGIAWADAIDELARRGPAGKIAELAPRTRGDASIAGRREQPTGWRGNLRSRVAGAWSASFGPAAAKGPEVQIVTGGGWQPTRKKAWQFDGGALRDRNVVRELISSARQRGRENRISETYVELFLGLVDGHTPGDPDIDALARRTAGLLTVADSVTTRLLAEEEVVRKLGVDAFSVSITSGSDTGVRDLEALIRSMAYRVQEEELEFEAWLAAEAAGSSDTRTAPRDSEESGDSSTSTRAHAFVRAQPSAGRGKGKERIRK